jgi:hypothetical protein
MALYHPAETPPFFEDWTPQDSLDVPCLCAEMSRLAYAPREVVARSLTNPKFPLRVVPK